ncbi:MAG: hypothetical protein OSB60_17260, partial [Myxococcota bacterium]|nr:hypothetical protein [Myxococcota bacterium]
SFGYLSAERKSPVKIPILDRSLARRLRPVRRLSWCSPSRLLQKLGFTHEGTVGSGGVTAKGDLVEGAIVGVLRSESLGQGT